MAYLRVASAALLVWLALLDAGVCYAAERIALACSGSMTSSWPPREPIDDDEGIIVDLDSGLVIWRDNAFPIVGNEGNMISFQSKMDIEPGKEVPPLTKGWLDRVTGAFHATYDFGSASQPMEEIYNLTCKRTNPVF
jgi:hypothetical protein